MKTKCLFLFCNDLAKDPVSPRIFDQCLKTLSLQRDLPTSILGNPVMVHETKNGALAYIAAIPHVASYCWRLLLPDLLRDFKDMAQIVLVNWHEGSKAPERIFCGHTAGDVPSGNFGPANPALLCSLLHAVEKKRKERGLDDWSTLLEATHWSGIPQGGRVDEMLSPGVPVIDFEIGSYPQDWSFAPATEAMAEAIADFDEVPEAAVNSLIFCGGEHFERGASQPLSTRRHRRSSSPITCQTTGSCQATTRVRKEWRKFCPPPTV